MGKLILRVSGTGLALWLSALLVLSQADSAKTVVFLGDSLSAGYGVKPNEAFPALISEKIRAASLPYQVENAGLSGDTTAGGLRRIDWLLQKPIDILVIELGINDAFRGVPVDQIRANLQAIIDRTKARHPHVQIVIAGMQLPINGADGYVRAFGEIFGELAAKNRAPLIPYLLDGVGGDPALNLGDLLHPNAAGQRILAENVWRVLEPVVRKGTTAAPAH